MDATKSYQELDQELTDTLDDHVPLQAFLFEKLVPTPLTISTMTIHCKPSIDIKLCVPDLKAYLEADPSMLPPGLAIKAAKKNKVSFRNCLLLTGPNASNPNARTTIKVFSNGGLHITGCKKIRDATQAAGPVWECIHKYLGMQEEEKEKEIKDLQVQLINSNFAINTPINLDKAYAVLNSSKYNAAPVHNKETHPGVIVKYIAEGMQKKVTAMLFMSGNIIITGAQNPADLLKTYCFITDFLEKEFDNIAYDGIFMPKKRRAEGEEKKKPGRKKKAQSMHFFESLVL
jgi:TATA-box binding protein (TBP) (component of TFIID and TFIIIB)